MPNRIIRHLILAYLVGALTACASYVLESFIVRANRLEKAGRYEEAAQEWIKATRLRNDYFPGYINAAEAYQRIGKFRESLVILDRAKKLRAPPQLHLLAGNARYRLGDYDGAIKDWNNLLEMQPHVAENYLRLGSAHKALGNWREALALYKRAEQIQPNSPDVHLSFARVLALRGDVEASIARLKTAKKLGVPTEVFLSDVELSKVRQHPQFLAVLQDTPENLEIGVVLQDVIVEEVTENTFRITASGVVPTSGWTVNLHSATYTSTPATWMIHAIGILPTGPALPAVTPWQASIEMNLPKETGQVSVKGSNQTITKPVAR